MLLAKKETTVENNNVTKVSAVKASWGIEGDHLVCRWFEARERAQQNSRWIHDPSRNVDRKNISQSVLDSRDSVHLVGQNATFRSLAIPFPILSVLTLRDPAMFFEKSAKLRKSANHRSEFMSPQD